MEIVYQIQIVTLAMIVFSAGILWNKVNRIEKKINKLDEHGEAIAVLKEKVKAIEARHL